MCPCVEAFACVSEWCEVLFSNHFVFSQLTSNRNAEAITFAEFKAVLDDQSTVALSPILSSISSLHTKASRPKLTRWTTRLRFLTKKEKVHPCV
jgi:hypothetical protein